MKKQIVFNLLFACHFVYASAPETKSKAEIIQIHGHEVQVADNKATLKKKGKEYTLQQVITDCQECGSPHQILIISKDLRQCDIELLKQALAQAKNKKT